MIEKQMIRLMLNKKFYTQYKGTLSPTVFAGDISSLYDTIQKAHEKYEEDIKVDNSSLKRSLLEHRDYLLKVEKIRNEFFA